MLVAILMQCVASAFVWEAPAFEAVALENDGTYQVWVWAEQRSRGELRIGGQGLSWSTRDMARGETAYRWVHVGEVALEAGPQVLEAPDAIAAVALGLSADFDPAASQGDRRIGPGPEGAGDSRALRERHTDTVFTMPHYESVAAWEAHAAVLRKRILIASGLYPMPEKTPLNARITGRIEYDDHSVENVAIEAYPGFFVTGNLYRPVGDGPFPGVICPHGHWEDGRLEHSDKASVPARGAGLARMGMVAFTYDMVGYVDSQQFEHGWGGPPFHIWGIHPFALQLWSAIRALDFLESLPEVDAERLACTGASGGGTQTFAASAVDPRIKVAAPVNMISSTMQGGCVCENAPLLRLDNSNMEIGALMAPRPLLLISATGDWTRETPRVEYPAIKSIYKLYGAEGSVENVHIDAGHNYNLASREAMYRFFGKTLLPEQDWSAYEEGSYTMEAPEQLRVFPDGLPADAPDQDALLDWLKQETAAKWQAILPRNDGEREAFRKEYGQALGHVLHAKTPAPNDLVTERKGRYLREGHALEHWMLGRKGEGDRIPALFYQHSGEGQHDAVLLVHGGGKGALANVAEGGPGPLVARLLARGASVLAIDVFGVGEHVALDGSGGRRMPRGFHDTFLPTDTAYRVQDVLTALAFLQSRRDLSGTVHIMGLEDGGLWAMMAAALDTGVGKVVADLGDRDFNEDSVWIEPFYIPAIRAIGGLDTVLALLQPPDVLEPGPQADRPKLTVRRGEAHFGADAPRWVALAGAEKSWPELADDLFRALVYYPQAGQETAGA